MFLKFPFSRSKPKSTVQPRKVTPYKCKGIHGSFMLLTCLSLTLLLLLPPVHPVPSSVLGPFPSLCLCSRHSTPRVCRNQKPIKICKDERPGRRKSNDLLLDHREKKRGARDCLFGHFETTYCSWMGVYELLIVSFDARKAGDKIALTSRVLKRFLSRTNGNLNFIEILCFFFILFQSKNDF